MTVVAVTGARGFLGTYAVSELEASGATVVRVGREPGGRLVRLDDTLGESRPDGLLDGVDVVVHLAGQLALRADAPVADYLDANVILTERLVREAVGAGARRFVFASSRLVYPGTLDRPAREDDVSPDTPYGLSKWFAERVIALHSTGQGMDSVSIRLSQLIGRGSDQGAVARFAAAARRGDPVQITGEGRAIRDVLDVRDAARAIRVASDAPSVPPVMNVGAGGRTIAELASAVAEAFGSTTIEHVPVEVEDSSHWSLDCSVAQQTLGWQPEFSLTDTIRDHFGVE